MKIAVLVKVLPDDQDITVSADGTLDYSRAKNTISTYDLNAIEAAALLASENSASLVAVAVGPASIDDAKTRKNILSRGVDELFIVADDELTMADSYQTGCVIAEVVKKIGDVDLVVAGDGSADLYAQQVDVQVAEHLDWVNVNACVELKADSGAISAKRILEKVSEEVSIALPAVVAVLPDIALPRIAGMKDILAAGKKPFTKIDISELNGAPEATVSTVEIKAPESTPRKKIVFDGSTDEGIKDFVDSLREVL